MQFEDNQLTETASLCLDRNMPFVLYSMPGTTEIEFMACRPESVSHGVKPGKEDCFFISRFGGDEPYVAGVIREYTLTEAARLLADHPDLNFSASKERPYTSSTVKASWEAAFKRVTRRLRKVGGKVVLSRHTALFSPRGIVDIAVEYISKAPGNFGYLCFTPETGVWYGSTPEVLLERKKESNLFRTMALAGTRWDLTAPWDAKNIIEHEAVRVYILETLRDVGLQPESGERTTLTTNGVEHLMTPITARGDVEFDRVMDALNPTPAVAGVPFWLAMAEIDTLESHQRRCYAGAVGVSIDGDVSAYVNLRCAFAAKAESGGEGGWLHNIYAGGGIMASSEPDKEWEELDRKSSVLNSIIVEGVDEGKVKYNPTDLSFGV